MMEDWGEFDTDLRAVYYEYSQTLFMEALRGPQKVSVFTY